MLVTLAFTALYDAASQFETPFGNDISDFHLNMFEKSLVLDIYSMLEVTDGTVTGEYAGSAYRRRRESQSIELLQMITDGDTRIYGDTRERFIESDNESDSSNDIESSSPPAVTNGLRYRSSSIARAPSLELELKADDEDTTSEERPLRSAPHASTARAESPPPPGSPPGRPVSPPSWRETPGLQDRHEFDDAEGDDDDGDE